MNYEPRVFFQETEEAARAVILIDGEAGLTTEERWQLETDWLVERINLPSGGTIIDYGCGIGRLAKRLSGSILGVDISPTMRAQADHHVRRSDFGAISPVVLMHLAAAGFRAQGAMTIWVLQHAVDPSYDLELLAGALEPRAPLYVVNRDERVVPSVHEGRFFWHDDGQDVAEILAETFDLEHEEPMPLELCAPGATFRRYIRR